MKISRKNKSLFILLMTIGLSLFLHLFRIDQEGFGNHYYSATVKNMLTGPANFFFGAFDSQGFVSVDKPPLGLWIQALFVLVFGFNGYSLILPSVIAGSLSVFLLYRIVRKPFGEIAGLISALVLALTPIFVALSRNNTMDAILISFLLWSILLFQNGIDKKSYKHVLLSIIVLGLSFNIKMVQALIILPSLLTVFILFFKEKISVKVLKILLAALIFTGVAFSWALVVDLTPEQNRPYVGGTQNNRVVELMTGYNGVDRLRENKDPISGPGSKNFHFETGEPGLFRLFNPLIGGQVSWFIPLALLGSLGYLIYSLMKSALGPRRKRGLVLWGSWFLIGYLYLNLNSGLFHTHYIAMIAPPLAALTGIGFVGLLKSLRSKTLLKWLIPGTLVVSVSVQFLLTRPFAEWNRPFVFSMLTVSGLAVCLIILSLFLKDKINISFIRVALIIGCLGQLIIPVAWALTPILYGGDPAVPYARPDLREFKISMERLQVVKREKVAYERLLTFLEKNRGDEQFLLGVESALAEGSNLMLITEGDILSIGGFNGLDPILTEEEMEALVADEKVRYFLVSVMGSYLNTATARVTQNGKIVLSRDWKNEGDLPGYTLYDCRPEENGD